MAPWLGTLSGLQMAATVLPLPTNGSSTQRQKENSVLPEFLRCESSQIRTPPYDSIYSLCCHDLHTGLCVVLISMLVVRASTYECWKPHSSGHHTSEAGVKLCHQKQ